MEKSLRFNAKLRSLYVALLLTTVVGCQDVPPRATVLTGNSASTGTDTTPTPNTVTRPTNAINFKSGFCACKDTKAVSYGDGCSNFCAAKSTSGAETLFANFTVSDEIAINSGLGSVHGWCTALLAGETVNPKCIIEAIDEDGNMTKTDVTPIAGTNSITANIQDTINYDKPYVLTLVEQISGARSDSIQLVKFSSELNFSTLGPLKNVPVSQYSCIVKGISTDSNTGDVYFDSAYRLHFYYIPRFAPSPVPAGTSNLVCHDAQQFGTIDADGTPRLEDKPGVFNLWDTNDPRFYDNNSNQVMDVNDIIIQKARNYGATGISATANFFTQFKWPGSPLASTTAGNTSNTQTIGHYMAPWIDQATYKSYCPTSTQYNSTNAIFKAMRDVIQVDTEGIYVGEASPVALQNLSTGAITSGVKDYILIRETELKKIWFYVSSSNVKTAPTDTNVGNVTVYFYYPPNPNYATPFVQNSAQRMYTVRSAAELSNVSSSTSSGSGSSGASSSLPPHDRKIGCVPKF